MQAVDIRFHQALVAAIQSERNKAANNLARGNAADFAAYKYTCGILEGLKMAQELADSLVSEADIRTSKDIFAPT